MALLFPYGSIASVCTTIERSIPPLIVIIQVIQHLSQKLEESSAEASSFGHKNFEEDLPEEMVFTQISIQC